MRASMDPLVEKVIWVIACVHILTTFITRLVPMITRHIQSNIYDAIQNQQWDVALQLLSQKQNHYHARFITNGSFKWWENGYNALHCACSYRSTPTDVVRRLLDAFADATIVQDEKGRTPLHYAVINASDDIVMMVLERFPLAASMVDYDGACPLLNAVKAFRSRRVIVALLETDPSMVNVKDSADNNPLSLFFSSWNLKLMALTLFDKVPCEQVLDIPVIFHSLSKGHVRDVYDLTIRFLETSLRVGGVGKGEDGDYPLLVVHKALEMGCPLGFVHLLSRVHPEQLWQCDRNGNHLLHKIVVVASKSNKFMKAIVNLLKIKPSSASIPNRNDRLALALAIENSYDKDIIEKLFYSAPNAIKTRDVDSHMIPFMMAANIEDKTTTTGDEDDDNVKKTLSLSDSLNKFELTYDLLMKDPTMVSYGIPE